VAARRHVFAQLARREASRFFGPGIDPVRWKMGEKFLRQAQRTEPAEVFEDLVSIPPKMTSDSGRR